MPAIMVAAVLVVAVLNKAIRIILAIIRTVEDVGVTTEIRIEATGITMAEIEATTTGIAMPAIEVTTTAVTGMEIGTDIRTTIGIMVGIIAMGIGEIGTVMELMAEVVTVEVAAAAAQATLAGEASLVVGAVKGVQTLMLNVNCALGWDTLLLIVKIIPHTWHIRIRSFLTPVLQII